LLAAVAGDIQMVVVEVLVVIEQIMAQHQ